MDLAAAHRRATETWTSRVRDPPAAASTPEAERCKDEITRYIRDGLDWKSWEKDGATFTRYAGNLNFAWCGAHVAWVLEAAGLTSHVRSKFLASTIRLHTYGKLDKRRFVEPRDLRPGDIAVVGRAKNPVDGDHITWVLHRSPNYFAAQEGNGRGEFPDGTIGEGVVRTIRPLSDVVLAYRPLPGDYL